jgi:hypothetical protein
MVTKTFCNRCGEEIPNPNTRTMFNIDFYPTGCTNRIIPDFCKDCFEAIMKFSLHKEVA